MLTNTYMIVGIDTRIAGSAWTFDSTSEVFVEQMCYNDL